ncbi:acyltransferase [Gordonia sp. CNJ-863]|uniref:acyltransferase family protein n=1 Tax=Gordonia sp. CNJ-863 TaxID=1904963 RepID=UPI00096A3211|nr:acyltransferase [Gordonia sp. CNJ-863]
MNQTARFHIPSLNGLRAVSILVVFIGHAKALELTVGGGIGVTIFFFISGYLITTLLRREYDRHNTISLKDFYYRRFLKIIPPMVVTILVGAILIQVGVIDFTISGQQIAIMLLFATNYARAFDFAAIPEPLFVLWSLSVEEHFYIVFPLIYIALRKWIPNRMVQAAILVAACTVILGWRSHLYFDAGVAWQPLNTRTDTRADALLWGCVLAVAFNPALDKTRGTVTLWKWFAAPAGAALIVAANLGTGFESHIGYTLQSLGIGLVVIPAIRYAHWWIFRPLNWRIVDWLGRISYSFYLVHYLVIWAIDSQFEMNGYLSTLASFVITTFLAWMMFKLVEEPLAKLRSKRSHAGERANGSESEHAQIAHQTTSRSARSVAAPSGTSES